MSKYSKRLAKGKKAWKDSKENYNQFECPVPSGTYKLQLQSAKLDESGNGNLMVKREHVVIGGEYENEVVHDNVMLEGEKGPVYSFVMQWLDRVDYDVDTLEVDNLEDTLEDVVKDAPICKGMVKVGEFTNVKILSLVEEGDTGEASEKEEKEEKITDPDEPASCYGEHDDKDDDCAKCEDKEVCEKKTAAGGKGKEKSGSKDEKQNAALIEFCQANEIKVDNAEVDDDTDSDDMIKAIKEEKFDKAGLEDDEVSLLEGIGAEDCMVEKTKGKAGKKGKSGKKKGKK